jgi:hypothetical protein
MRGRSYNNAMFRRIRLRRSLPSRSPYSESNHVIPLSLLFSSNFYKRHSAFPERLEQQTKAHLNRLDRLWLVFGFAFLGTGNLRLCSRLRSLNFGCEVGTRE